MLLLIIVVSLVFWDIFLKLIMEEDVKLFFKKLEEIKSRSIFVENKCDYINNFKIYKWYV